MMEPQEHPESRLPQGDAPRQEPFRCKFCGADTEEKVVQAALRGARGWLILEDIPAWVCKECGEQFYDDQTAEKIERITTDPAARAAHEITVPVFSLASSCRPGA